MEFARMSNGRGWERGMEEHGMEVWRRLGGRNCLGWEGG